MTNMKRITISLPEELETEIYSLRQYDAYSRCSKSEIVRRLVRIGLETKFPKLEAKQEKTPAQ